MIDKNTLLIATLIALVSSIGVQVTPDLFNNELKDYYICSIDDNIQEFAGGISGTGYSGYPFIDSRKSAQYCGTSDNKGSWESLKDYAEFLGLDPYDLIQSEEMINEKIPPQSWGSSYICYPEPKGCIKE